MQPPTSRLPPIKFISTHSPDSLRDALAYLRSIYNPPVRGSRMRKTQTPAQTRRRDADTIDDSDPPTALDADALRTDAFERSYTIKWLTALTAQSGLSDLGEDDGEEEYEKLIEDAASLLAICAGTASAGVITRRFVFDLTDPRDSSQSTSQSTGDLEHETSEVNTKTITVDLKDVPLDNHDYGSVGAQTWGGACVMAEMLAADPRAFGLCGTPNPTSTSAATPTASSSSRSPPSSTGDTTRRLRCLELGAGTGLVSLAAGKVVQQLSSSSAYNYAGAPEGLDVEVEIVATDYYPSVLKNLEENVRVNFPSSASSLSSSAPDVAEALSSSAAPSSNLGTNGTSPRLSITTHHLDWSSFSSTLPSFSASSSSSSTSPSPLPENPVSEPFDVIYGADIIYEALHATWIKGCLRRLLRKPKTQNDDDAGGVFHLIIPLRSTHAKESGTVETVFGDNTPGSLGIRHKETIVCDAEEGASGKGDEVVYAYYRIGWNDDYAATARVAAAGVS